MPAEERARPRSRSWSSAGRGGRERRLSAGMSANRSSMEATPIRASIACAVGVGMGKIAHAVRPLLTRVAARHDFGLDRIGDEALLVGGMVQPVEIVWRRAACRRRRRSAAAASPARSSSVPRRSSPSRPRPRPRRLSMTKPARRARSRKVSMWQDESEATKASSGSIASSAVEGLRHDPRRGGGLHLDAAVEAPEMAARIAALGEVGRRIALPGHGRGVEMCHDRSLQSVSRKVL